MTIMKSTTLLRLLEAPFIFLGFLGIGLLLLPIGAITVTIEAFTRPRDVSLSKFIDHEIQL
jgi:hypothetical protein